MGKEARKTILKTLRKIGNLKYVEVRGVPMHRDPEFGNLIDAKVIERVEKLVAKGLILKEIPIRGREVAFLRSVFALSQRDFAERLGLSHVAIFKWEKAKNRRLDLVNEVAVKVLVSGLLGLDIQARLDSLVGHGDTPKRLALDYSDADAKSKEEMAA